MKFRHLFLFTVMFIFFTHAAYSQLQENKPAILWKKLVVRIIDTRDTLDGNGVTHHNISGDRALLKSIAQAAITHKISVYKGDLFYEKNFEWGSPLTQAAINEYINPPADTIMEYKNNKDTTIIKLHGSFPTIKDTKIRVAEMWSYDPAKKVTEIRILGVAPVKEYYGYDDTFYRGSAPLFWIKWEDIKNIVQGMPMLPRGISGYLWDDYFSSGGVRADTELITGSYEGNKGNIFSKSATRLLTIIDTDSREERAGDHISDWSFNSPLSEIIYTAVKEKGVAASVSPAGATAKILQPRDINVWIPPDTVEFEDIDGGDMKKIVHINVNWATINKFMLSEQWKFDAGAGVVTIQIMSILPRFDKKQYTGDEHTIHYTYLFWVKHKDIAALLTEYDNWNPLNNFSTTLWNGYFSNTVSTN